VIDQQMDGVVERQYCSSGVVDLIISPPSCVRTPFPAGEDILVPLTSSLYVPGRIVKDAEMIVDIGAGYLVGRSPADAKEILTRKGTYIKANTDSLMKVINMKQGNLTTVREVIAERKAAAPSSSSSSSSSAAP
jgi:prefoldin alpha subunit